MSGAARARADLNALLDRHENNPASTRLGITIDRSTFANQRTLDEYLAALTEAAAGGAIFLVPGRGKARHAPPKVRLRDPASLYQLLSRRPSRTAAEEALSTVAIQFAEDWMGQAFAEIHRAWSRRHEWYGVSPGNSSQITSVAALAAAIVADQHTGQDYRSLSVAIVGDSKFLERNEPAVARFVSFGRELGGGHPRAMLSSIGLDRISSPLHLAGPTMLGGMRVPDTVPYVAIPHAAVQEVGFYKAPRLLLTIENFVSFHRYAIEANPDASDLVIYTGGQPSFSWHNSITVLMARLPLDLPMFHWSDIDAGGLEIFRRIEAILGPVRPHLMTIDLAERFGSVPPSPVVRPGQFAGSAVEPLAEYLATPRGRCVEQEAIDPSQPII